MQLNKTRACPHKVDLTPIAAHDSVPTSSSPASSSDEPNGEVEYEYYGEENHAGNNGNGNIMSSTESKSLPSQSPKDDVPVTENVQSPNSEKTNYESFHPNVHPNVHPKLDAGTATKADSKNSTQNRSSSHCSDHNLLSCVLVLALLLPLINR